HHAARVVAREGREVHGGIERAAAEVLLEIGGGAGAAQPLPASAERGRRAATVGEGHLIAGGGEPPRGAGAGEARGAGEEDLHGTRSFWPAKTRRAASTRSRASSTVAPSATRWPIFRPRRGSDLP